MLICDNCNRIARQTINGLCPDCHKAHGPEAQADGIGGEISRALGVRYDGYNPERRRNGKVTEAYLQFTDMGCTLTTFCLPAQTASISTGRIRLAEIRQEYAAIIVEAVA